MPLFRPGREFFSSSPSSSMAGVRVTSREAAGGRKELGRMGYHESQSRNGGNMNLTRTVILVLLTASLTACAGIRPAPPEVQLSGLEITDLSLSHANFLARLQLYNPNDVSLDIKNVKFTLFLNDVRVAEGQSIKPLTIPAEKTAEATLRLSSSFFNLYQLTRTLQNQEQVAFHLVGEVKVGGPGFLSTTIPIEHQGALPLVGTLNRLRPETSQGGALP